MKKRNVLSYLSISLVWVATVGLGACSFIPGFKGPALKTPRLLFDLPEKYNAPDGMCLTPDGTIYLSMTNANLKEYPAKILKITQDDKLVELCDLPAHPETGVACPLGISLGADGNFYVADNQSFATAEPNKARLFRINMQDGQVTGVDVVAVGFNMSNAVACRGDFVYVTETNLDVTKKPLPSGVYRFSMEELRADTPVKVTGIGDPHLIVQMETVTEDPALQVGANGMAFDSKGNMYVCNFGEASIIKVTFDSQGNVATQREFVRGKGMLSTDGIFMDANDVIWVADFIDNAVHSVDTKTGKVTTIARNGQTDGTDGLLDAPSEVCVRDGVVYVSNIDLTHGPNVNDRPYTMSAIDLN